MVRTRVYININNTEYYLLKIADNIYQWEASDCIYSSLDEAINLMRSYGHQILCKLFKKEEDKKYSYHH
jgi:hypothetical protein